MAGITVSGLGSGLDINGLVDKLVAAERAPASNRLDRREANLQAELSGVGTFKGALSELQSAIKGLTDPAKFEAMKVTAGDSDLFTAAGTGTAQIGNYSIEVKNLAQAHKMASGRFNIASDDLTTATVTTGDLSFDFNGDGAPDVQVGAAAATLTGIRDAINNKADLGVRANIVNDGSGYRLTLSATKTGVAKALAIAVTGSDVPAQLLISENAADVDTRLHTTFAARDAEVIIDGLKITSASNTVTGVLDGVTLNLKSAKPGTATDLTVAQDTAAVTSAVNAFVSAYNKFANTTAALTAYNPQTKEKGPLLGDAGVRSAVGQLRHALGEPVTGKTLRSLSDIGISAQRDGTLKLDSGALQKALEKDPKAVAALFTGAEGSAAPIGIAKRLDDFFGKLLGSDGPLASRTTSLNKRIDLINGDRVTLERRLQEVQTRYRAQFQAMDQLVSKLTATGNFLTQQLAGLSNNSK